jgi:hypothetical protein
VNLQIRGSILARAFYVFGGDILAALLYFAGNGKERFQLF